MGWVVSVHQAAWNASPIEKRHSHVWPKYVSERTTRTVAVLWVATQTQQSTLNTCRKEIAGTQLGHTDPTLDVAG